MEYDNTNTFALFKNKKKEEGSKQPDYKGTMNIDGVEKEIAAWIRVSSKGEKFMSGTIKEPFNKEKNKNNGNSATTHAQNTVDSEDIPF